MRRWIALDYIVGTVIQTREHMNRIKAGEVQEVLADDPAAEEDIKRFAKRTGHEIVKFEKKEDHMRCLIKKLN